MASVNILKSDATLLQCRADKTWETRVHLIISPVSSVVRKNSIHNDPPVPVTAAHEKGGKKHSTNNFIKTSSSKCHRVRTM